MATRVLIVDDDPRFRALARALLNAAGHTVVAEAADGTQALAALRRVRPDAALLDVQLPDTNGLELARELAANDNTLRILLTSTDPTLVSPTALADTPALAFVPRTNSPSRTSRRGSAADHVLETTPRAPFSPLYFRTRSWRLPSRHDDSAVTQGSKRPFRLA